MPRYSFSSYNDNNLDSSFSVSFEKAGVVIVGLSKKTCNPTLQLPENRILFNDIKNFVLKINEYKKTNSELTLLSGLEVSYDPMKESFFGEMRKKVDYLVLDQTQVFDGLNPVDPNNNPNYPIVYADMICKALDSGLFDMVANMDSFIKYGETIKNLEDKKVFDDDVLSSSQVICEKARDMNVPLIINVSTPLNQTFWNVAKEIDGLRLLYGGDLKDIKLMEMYGERSNSDVDILSSIQNKIIKTDFNPVVARQNNSILLEKFEYNQEKALTYESNVINSVISSGLENLGKADSNSIYQTILNVLNDYLNKSMVNGKALIDGIISESKNMFSNAIVDNNAREKYDRNRLVINTINLSITKIQSVVETAKQSLLSAVNIGCSKKEEFLNIITQLMEYNTTKKSKNKLAIQDHILQFQNSKLASNSGGRENNTQLVRINPNTGFIDFALMGLFVSFLIGLAIGIGYILYIFR